MKERLGDGIFYEDGRVTLDNRSKMEVPEIGEKEKNYIQETMEQQKKILRDKNRIDYHQCVTI